MGDGWAWNKRQQETARQKKELERIGFAETPNTATFRNTDDGSGLVELCAVINGTHHIIKRMKPEEAISLCNTGTACALQAWRYSKRT